MDETKPKLRVALEAEHADGSRETIIVRRLTNTDTIKWLDTGLSKEFLVFRSVERAGPGQAANQAWFDALEPASALAVVEQALALNHSLLQKKILAEISRLLSSFLSETPSSFSPAGEPTPTTLPITS